MNIKNVKQWETIVSVKDDKDINIFGSIINPKRRDEFVITGFPFNSKREMMFHLVEYNKDMYPQTGIVSYVVSKKELEENFEIVGKWQDKYLDNE